MGEKKDSNKDQARAVPSRFRAALEAALNPWPGAAPESDVLEELDAALKEAREAESQKEAARKIPFKREP